VRRRFRNKPAPPQGQPLAGRGVLGANIRRARKRLGLSQEDLAERADLHWTYVGSVERGERNISIDNICRLAWALGLHPTRLLKEPKPTASE
jgi:transcriptional regulator with XRE-family HTH domain